MRIQLIPSPEKFASRNVTLVRIGQISTYRESRHNRQGDQGDHISDYPARSIPISYLDWQVQPQSPATHERRREPAAANYGGVSSIIIDAPEIHRLPRADPLHCHEASHFEGRW